MVQEYIYSPHYDFYIDFAKRPRGYDMRSFHFHKKYEIYYEVEGTRRYFIENSTYIVNPGNLVLIGQDSVHKTGSVEDMAHARYVLNFNPDYLAPLAATLPGVDLLACFAAGEHVLQIAPGRQKTVESLLARLWEGRDSDAPRDIALRKLWLAELLLTLGHFAADGATVRPRQVRNTTIEGVQSYISTRYAQPLTLGSIAAQFYISEQYLSRLFKKTTGLSVVEYITSIRLTAAKNLLENSPMRVAEVGEAVGFGTTTHFSRAFKESTGLPPQQYRKLYNRAVSP